MPAAGCTFGGSRPADARLQELACLHSPAMPAAPPAAAPAITAVELLSWAGAGGGEEASRGSPLNKTLLIITLPNCWAGSTASGCASNVAPSCCATAASVGGNVAVTSSVMDARRRRREVPPAAISTTSTAGGADAPARRAACCTATATCLLSCASGAPLLWSSCNRKLRMGPAGGRGAAGDGGASTSSRGGGAGEGGSWNWQHAG